jgi:hypothetical protein
MFFLLLGTVLLSYLCIITTRVDQDKDQGRHTCLSSAALHNRTLLSTVCTVCCQVMLTAVC